MDSEYNYLTRLLRYTLLGVASSVLRLKDISWNCVTFKALRRSCRGKIKEANSWR